MALLMLVPLTVSCFSIRVVPDKGPLNARARMCVCVCQHEACNRGLVAVATLLLDNGAMIDVPGHENETALHDAVNNGRVDCVRLLVSRGASLALRSADYRIIIILLVLQSL